MIKSAFLFISVITLTALTSCTKDRTITGFDAELFEKSQKTDGFVYYNLNSEFLEPPKKTGHKSKYFRTKYNNIAASVLDEFGLITNGTIFPEGSLIVNEMGETKGPADKYAIMFKDPKNPYADEFGWVWSYVNSDNTIIEPSSRKGVNCIECHSKSDQNKTLMSDNFQGTKK